MYSDETGKWAGAHLLLVQVVLVTIAVPEAATHSLSESVDRLCLESQQTDSEGQ